ncbi:MAG: nucleotidyl transferase AbiEii/AbiGii toxin family protein [Gammaproteobacteria bacterium]
MTAWLEFKPREILGLLTTRGVDFVVIGGYAAVLHGSPRVTQDLDITFATDPPNLEALGKVLTELGARLSGVDEDVPFVADERTLTGVELLTLETDLGKLDLLALPAGAPPYADLRERAARFDVGGFLVRVADIRQLIAMKEVAGRPKDLADIAELDAIARLRGG